MKLISPHTVIAILVKDQAEALCFYTEHLGLEKRSDVTFGPGLRFLTVAAPDQYKPEIALARPDILWHSEKRVKAVMERVGRKVSSVFATDNCRKEYELLQARGVQFVCAPTEQLYGLEAIFVDPDGNAFSLLEASPEVRSLFEKQSVGTAA